MNKRKIIASLNNIANELDITGLYKEANTITNIMTKLAASIYDTDQFWIIRGIVRPVTSHEAQTDTIINEQYRNDVLRILEEEFSIPLRDCMDDFDYTEIFSDMGDFFSREKYDMEETLGFVYDSFCEKHDCEEDEKENYIQNKLPKIRRLAEPYFRAMKDPVRHAIDELGWIRVNGSDIEIAQPLNDYTKSTIRRAMDEIHGDKAARMNFNIDSTSGFKTLSYEELY